MSRKYVNVKISITPHSLPPKIEVNSGGAYEKEIIIDKFIKVKVNGKSIEIY